MAEKKEIEKIILSMSGKYAPYNIFSDWVEMCALSIQNTVSMIHNKIWRDREKLYVDIANKYTDAELSQFAQMFVLLGYALESDMSDILGEIYMETGMGSKYTGQFFTPFHLSELCARIGINEKDIESHKKLTLHEPSCGGGGMIIATCKVLHEMGYPYQKNLDVLAQDLDWKGVYMTYLQLSLIGCKATVVQGDTLIDPYTENYPKDRIMRTPAKMGMLI